MKLFNQTTTFCYSWDQVVGAFWKRYPNPFSQHVLSEDVLERRMVGRTLYTKRLLVKTNSLPKWGERFISVRTLPVLEESIIDLDSKCIRTFTRNIHHKKVMNVEESVTYEPKNNLVETLVTKQAKIMSHIYGFSFAIEAFGYERFKKNSSKANKGYIHILSAIHDAKMPKNSSTDTLERVFEETKETFKDVARGKAKLAKGFANSPLYVHYRHEA